ncbi:hypothetical protein ACIHFD_49505 [Nonomuraea sp. NPDC051941]|uniref:hypothetical protein n=1 Tax=Nonomuraea sp. NPDC051941 TaxID=3364373 RepID=UPI0037C7C058
MKTTAADPRLDFTPPDDPALERGGPHWHGCERTHSGCAYRLGLAHGEHHLARRLDTLLAAHSMPDDPDTRYAVLREVRDLVRHAAGLPATQDDTARETL